jgi:deoxycytidylate deaminase
MKSWVAQITIKNAKKSQFPRFRHSCTIEKGGSIISSGVNTYKPRTPHSSFSVHAEIVPLKRLLTILARSKKKDKFELYVARIDTTDNQAFSKPCPKCLKAIQNSGAINIVHFTTDKGWESFSV